MFSYVNKREADSVNVYGHGDFGLECAFEATLQCFVCLMEYQAWPLPWRWPDWLGAEILHSQQAARVKLERSERGEALLNTRQQHERLQMLGAWSPPHLAGWVPIQEAFLVFIGLCHSGTTTWLYQVRMFTFLRYGHGTANWLCYKQYMPSIEWFHHFL